MVQSPEARVVQHDADAETATRVAHRPGPDPRPSSRAQRDVQAVRSAHPAPEFPGCRAVTITREDIATWEGRFEYWDAQTETAWVVCEPTSAYHEHPSHLLAALARTIAHVRGSPIECFGAMDLRLRDESGKPRKILQADQSVYLHPGRSRLPGHEGMVLGEHTVADVVLEVDHTTDVRRGKMWLYEEWGFPEVWVEVPEEKAPSRPKSRRPGLTIHVLEGGVYRESAVSLAFPGWTAEEIHTALSEKELSAGTSRALDRVGRALGEREGTGPDGMPWLRGHRREARAEGQVEGRAEGLAKGRAEGLAKGRAEGLAEGRAEGIERQRALLCRQAARRFGEETAAPLSARLARIDDPERLAEVGDWIVDCATGAELLARTEHR